jgi:hypothetical protein
VYSRAGAAHGDSIATAAWMRHILFSSGAQPKYDGQLGPETCDFHEFQSRLRSIDAAFEPKMAQSTHGYCAFTGVKVSDRGLRNTLVLRTQPQ